MIPSDVFRARETPKREHALIRDAAAAQMNCIRVWGGALLARLNGWTAHSYHSERSKTWR